MNAQAVRARTRAEENHPARLLGVAQVAIEVALRTNDLAEVHAQLEQALARIKPTEVPGMSTQCTHPRTGRVASHPAGYTNGSHAATDVCDRPECIAEALAWVERMSRKPAHHVLDAQKTEVTA